mmetsp:Transcript_20394/g.51533  ORF Transcript_20394/g.51533 Transcript_20394/m.51533 type:complete len:193 (-) Transcript_20394:95-673(-)
MQGDERARRNSAAARASRDREEPATTRGAPGRSELILSELPRLEVPEELKFQTRLLAEDAEPEAPAARRVQVMQKPSEQHSSSASSGSNVSTAAQRLRRASFIEATEGSEELPCTESEAPAPRQKKKKKKKKRDRLPVPELVAQQPPSPRTETNLKTTNRIATTVKPRTIATTVAKTPVVSDAQREAMRNYF